MVTLLNCQFEHSKFCSACVSFGTTVEFRFFEPTREMKIGSKNREFEKSKVASKHTCFTVVLFYMIQEGRQQRYITLVNV